MAKLHSVTAVVSAMETMMQGSTVSGARAAVFWVTMEGLVKVTLASRPKEVKDEPGQCLGALYSRQKEP